MYCRYTRLLCTRNIHIQKKIKEHVTNIAKLRLATREEIELSYRAEKNLNKVIYKHKLLHFNLQCSVFLPPNICFERNFGTDYSLIYGSHIAQFS